MNNFLKLVVYGLGGAIGGWIVAALITLVLAVFAGILDSIGIRFLIMLVVLLSLAAPVMPALGIGSLVSGANTGSSMGKKTAGLIAAAIAVILASIPLVLIINDNFPIDLMTNTLEQPDWVGTVMTWFTWLMVALSPIIAFALAADISSGAAEADPTSSPPA